jgi:PAS domain S-box-containing protein
VLPRHDSVSLVAAAGIVAITFAIDITTPPGFAVGVFPHFIAIGITAWSTDRRIPIAITLLASFATLAGYILTAGPSPLPLLFNRLSLVTAYWILTFLVLRKQIAEIRLAESNASLERKVEERTRNLRTLAERLRLATRSAGIGIWEWNVSTDRLISDDRIHTIFGFAQQDFPGTMAGCQKTWHPEDSERVRTELAAALDGEADFHSQFRICRPDGTTRTVECHAQSQHIAESDAVRMIGVCRDITDVVQIELELRQAQKMEAMGQLTGGIAHDFNNLLAVIMGNLELLAEQLDTGNPGRPLLDSAFRSTLRGAELTQRLLAYARKQPLRPRTTDINGLVLGTGEMLRRSIREDIRIEITLHPHALFAMADPHQVENALLNLVINARDALPRGGEIVIGTAPATDQTAQPEGGLAPGNYVLVTVIDSGTGMSPDVLSRAFEPFFTTKDVGAGSGLGLSMVFGLAKQSGGHFEISSEEGVGTQCKLYLPAVASPDVTETPETGAATARNYAAADGGGKETILVVEDDSQLRVFLETALSQLGYRILTATDGPDAIARMEKLSALDLLLADVIMPNGVSGPQVASAGRALFPGLRVLFMSGYPLHESGGLRELGEDVELLSKPFTRAQLAQVIRRILDAA